MKSLLKISVKLRQELREIIYNIGPDWIFIGLFSSIYIYMRLTLPTSKGNSTQSSLIIESFLSLLISIFITASPCIYRFAKSSPNKCLTCNTCLRFSYQVFKDWLPFMIVFFIYHNFADFTYLIFKNSTIDGHLKHIDDFIFGSTPVFFFEHFRNRLLNEYMTFAYALHFIHPTFVAGILYYKANFKLFREFALAINATFYLGFIGYMLAPALGPRYFLEDILQQNIQGFFLTEAAATLWNNLETVKRDCFPSLHTAISTVALIYLYRYHHLLKRGKVIFNIVLILILSLWISTVYLRYHWAIDVLAGLALAAFTTQAAPRVLRYYYLKTTKPASSLLPNLEEDLLDGYQSLAPKS